MNYRSISTNTTKKQIFILSIPVFFSNLATPLVGIIDTGLMGNLGDAKYLASISIATSVITMIVWSFGFLRMGTVGIVAQLYAKSEYREIVKTLLRNFIFAIIISLILLLIKPLILNLIKINFQVSKETYELIKTYISVRIFSIPAELSIYILIGFYLGIQKTKISSLLIIMMSALNIILSSYFVLSLNLNVFGVALGSLIACYLVFLLFAIYTYNFIKIKFQIIPGATGLLVVSKFKKLFHINLDIFIRTVILTFSFLWVTYLSSKLGEDYLATNAILLQFIVFASFFLDAYAYSTEGLVGYSVGRKNKRTFLTTVQNSIQISFFTALIISLLYLIFFKQIINVITDIEMLKFIAYKHMIWILIIPPAASFCYQFDGIFIGSTQTRDMRNAMILSVSSFILLSIYLTKALENHGLWLSLLIFMILRTITLNLFFNNIYRKFR